MNKIVNYVKNVLTVIALALLALLIFTPSSTNKDSKNNDNSVKVEESASPVSTATPQQSSESKQTYDSDTMRQFLESYGEATLKSLGDDMEATYEINDNMITFSATTDGIAAAATSANLGDNERRTEWNTMVNSLKDTFLSVKQGFDDRGIDAHVSFRLLNDKDPELVLLQIIDGAVLYNAVTE